MPKLQHHIQLSVREDIWPVILRAWRKRSDDYSDRPSLTLQGNLNGSRYTPTYPSPHGTGPIGGGGLVGRLPPHTSWPAHAQSSL